MSAYLLSTAVMTRIIALIIENSLLNDILFLHLYNLVGTVAYFF